jgi:hypothetical protein
MKPNNEQIEFVENYISLLRILNEFVIAKSKLNHMVTSMEEVLGERSG